MSYKQFWVNNFETTLDGAILAGDFAFNIAAGAGAALPTLVGGSGTFFHLTIDDGAGNIEIVRVRAHTAASDNLGGVVRGVDGTTALGFADGTPVYMRIVQLDMDDKIGTSRYTVSGLERNAIPASSVDITPERANPTDVPYATSVQIGAYTSARGSGDVAIGYDIQSLPPPFNAYNVAIGNGIYREANSENTISIGGGIYNQGNRNILIGPQNTAYSPYGPPGDHNIVLGEQNSVFPTQAYTITIGYYSSASGGSRDIILGNNNFAIYGAINQNTGLLSVSATPFVKGGGTSSYFPRMDFSGSQWFWAGPSVDLTVVASFDVLPSMPTPIPAPLTAGGMFYIDELGIALTTPPGSQTAPGVLTLPNISFGFGSGDASLLGATAVTGLTNLGDRQKFTPLTANGTRTLGFDVTSGGTTGSYLYGRFIFKGICFADSD